MDKFKFPKSHPNIFIPPSKHKASHRPTSIHTQTNKQTNKHVLNGWTHIQNWQGLYYKEIFTTFEMIHSGKTQTPSKVEINIVFRFMAQGYG
jgi:hypothetical protein